MFVTIAAERLKSAGYDVIPADGVPGLFDVPGLARDVTVGQLADLAKRYAPVQLLPVGGILPYPGS